MTRRKSERERGGEGEGGRERETARERYDEPMVGGTVARGMMGDRSCRERYIYICGWSFDGGL